MSTIVLWILLVQAFDIIDVGYFVERLHFLVLLSCFRLDFKLEAKGRAQLELEISGELSAADIYFNHIGK